MKLDYKVVIENPHLHQVMVTITGKRKKMADQMAFFLPSWSPGSYLMREYSRHVTKFQAYNNRGENLYFEQVEKGVWQIDWKKSLLKSDDLETFTISYKVYCHELTVRTSHITEEHAFLHGPSYLMGVVGEESAQTHPRLELVFPPLWSHVSTGLKNISNRRDLFLYSAESYDELIDCPIEIGCHDCDGFRVGDKDHYLAFYGRPLAHKNNLKKDMQIIVEEISRTMGEIPYENYTFITHFVPHIAGGLEHLNSTALQFCALKLNNRKSYIDWLTLVAHEYFHTWNIKRIRPRELGPFSYRAESYSKMLWLGEGLTVFMDELFVLRAGLMSTAEYLENLTSSMNRYLKTPGRAFDSLESSSFNTWIKFYRPDENSLNSTVSYYLKGGLAFFCLNALLFEKGKGIDDLLALLWQAYKKRPEKGLLEGEVFQMVEDLAGGAVRETFETMIQTTEEIDLELFAKKIGLEFMWKRGAQVRIGIVPQYKNERVFIKSVELDSPASKYGVNCGDELLAIDGLRITKSTFKELVEVLMPDRKYRFTVTRNGRLIDLSLIFDRGMRTLDGLKVWDEKNFRCASSLR